MFSYSSIVNNGKVTLPSVDTWGTNMNIIRDPPKSIMTRRRDKVGENNDMLKMIDNSDRSTDAILRFARGVNPSVSVSYSNSGGLLQNSGKQAFLPYTINKDGDFKPPVPAPQDLLALSRLPRNTTFAITNPTMPHYGKVLDNSRNQKTSSSVKQQIISAQVKPKKSYFVQKPFQEAFEQSKNGIYEKILNKSANSQVKSTNRTILNVLEPTKEINKDIIYAFVDSNKQDNQNFVNNNVFDPNRFLQDTNAHSVFSNVKSNSDNHFEVNLNNIKTKDYNIIEYSTPLKSNNDMKYIHENFELERTLPEYEANKNYGNIKGTSYIHDDIELERTLPEYKAKTNYGNIQGTSYIHDDIELERTLPEYKAKTNYGNIQGTSYIHEDIELERTLPEYETRTNLKSLSQSNVFFDIELDRVLPVYNSHTNNKGFENTKYIHKDLELQRTLPEYDAKTNIKQNIQKTLKHDYQRDLERKAYLSNMSTNSNNKGEYNVSSRHYNLEDKLQLGEFQMKPSIPTFDRMQTINENFETEKSKMGKMVMEQFKDRYNK